MDNKGTFVIDALASSDVYVFLFLPLLPQMSLFFSIPSIASSDVSIFLFLSLLEKP